MTEMGGDSWVASVGRPAWSEGTGTATFSGYCAECGTWDDHGANCACCGYAFTGDAPADPSGD